MPAAYRARIEAARPQLYQVAREQYGLELKAGPFGIDSRPALIGAKYAASKGLADAYSAAVFRAYWLEARDISQLDLLAEIAAGLGLDRGEFLLALADPAFAAEVDADIAQAHAYNLNAVPATVLADRYLVMGAQPYPLLREAVAQVIAEQAGQ